MATSHVSESERFYAGLNRVLRSFGNLVLAAMAILGLVVIVGAAAKHDPVGIGVGAFLVSFVATRIAWRSFRRR